jgi:hypothetical protein
MNVHLAVPDLFWPEPAAVFPEQPAVRMSALETLLARGRRSAQGQTDLEAWCLARWRAPDGLVAPYALLADGGEPGAAFWLRADPCHLSVGQDRLTVVDATRFDIDRAEAAALVASLNRHFAHQGLAFLAVRPSRWYARADAAPAVPTPPLAAARGRALENRAGGAVWWRAIENELQMLLHAHPVNAAREARGELPVNSVWLWGGGRLAVPAASPFRRVRSADPLPAGLALAAGARALPLPEDAADWLRAAPNGGVDLVVLDQLREPAGYGDGARWLERLGVLERSWFAPLLGALRAGRIGMVTLHAMGAGGALDAETTRQDLRHFWRRARPLAEYAR